MTLSSSCDDDSLGWNKPPIGLGFPLKVRVGLKDKADLEESYALVKVLLLRSVQLLRYRREHLVRRRDELWVSKDRATCERVNPIATTNEIGVLLLGQLLCEESLHPKTLTVVVPKWDRSLGWVVKRLDMHRGVVGIGGGRHNRWRWKWRESNGWSPFDLEQRDG